ncbi:glycosyltransferase family 2 protein [Marivirga sp.]|uniref:glycosyltransferase family 2 protein n=1 Tax=Marivirga sp. TaxID=2018662 RepID=UPI0025F91623|nr:glycosyltransferase family 2 protein [Marivirga sp.]
MISIIIPTYNRAHLITQSIESVKNQTFSSWELIIVDDGSTDNTQEVVKLYLADKRIKYIQKENTGAAHSRNVGVEKASYDWVTFLDSDDKVKLDWLKVFANMILSNPKSVLYSVGVTIKYNDKTSHHTPSNDEYIKGGHITRFNAGAYLLKKLIFIEIGGFDSDLRSIQHTDLGIRILEYLNTNFLSSTYSTQSLVIIYKHSGERIQNDWRAVQMGTLKIIDKYKNSVLPKKTISSYYNVASYASFKLGDKKKSIELLKNSIRYNPLNIKLYLKFIYFLFKSISA